MKHIKLFEQFINEGLDAKDKISPKHMQEIDLILNKFTKSYYGDASYDTLFDPVQTHAIYGIDKNNQKWAKEELKSLGATKFRVVGLTICFDASKMI